MEAETQPWKLKHELPEAHWKLEHKPWTTLEI
jgi:hypothetical protein